MYKEIENAILKAFKDGYKSFIIYPFGEVGMYTKKILEDRYGYTDILLIDNILSEYNSSIFHSKYLDDIDLKESAILFTSKREVLFEELYEKPYFSHIYAIYPNIVNRKVSKVGKCCYGPIIENIEQIEKIGSFCSFAPGTCVVWNHPLKYVTTHAFIYSPRHAHELKKPKFNMKDFNKKTTIGNDVWLGQNVIITNGVNIGNGVIAAAGSVITKDIPDYAVVAGVPAKIIKYRFKPEQIKKLNSIRWWDWSLKTISERYDDFIDIDIFIDKYYDFSLYE